MDREKLVGGTKVVVKHPAVIASIVSVFFTGVSGWQIAKRLLTPLLIETVQKAVAADTDKRIDTKTAPILEVMQANKESQIDELQDKVNLETLRKQQSGAKWTQFDELQLSQLVTRLRKETAKLEEIKKASKEAKDGASK